MVLDDDLSRATIKNTDTVEGRQVLFTRWRDAIEVIELEVRTLSHLESDSDTARQGFDTARTLRSLINTLKIATGNGATIEEITDVDTAVVRVTGEANVLGELWDASIGTDQ